MKRHTSIIVALLAPLTLLISGCSSGGASELGASPAALEVQVTRPMRFVAYGDTRFHDPRDTHAADAGVRRALVAAIDKEHPAFISISGDIVYTGANHEDWQVWESETAAWREHKIPVFPALGNHDLNGDQNQALANYFAHFPDLKGSRFYSTHAGNVLMLSLDSSEEEVSGPQGDWLHAQLSHIVPDVDFVFLVFHHPVYTHSSDEKVYGGGHSARPKEEALGQFLEATQKTTRARLVVFNGHVHNYERYEHGGVLYFVTGGGGARPYSVQRQANDPYQDTGVNYHYLLINVNGTQLTVTMKKLEIKDGKELWTPADTVTRTAPAATPAAAD